MPAIQPEPDAPPTPEELPALAGHVEYEFQMLASAGVALLETPWDYADGRQGVQRNAWVEVLLLHLRNLIHFFAGRPQRDDVVASHYIADWSVRDDGGDELEWLVERTRPIHKRLAHITAHRERVHKSVDAELIQDIGRNVVSVYQRFLARLTDEQRSWFALREDSQENADRTSRPDIGIWSRSFDFASSQRQRPAAFMSCRRRRTCLRPVPGSPKSRRRSKAMVAGCTSLRCDHQSRRLSSGS